jgi:CRP-like cAMP-binding protein
VPAAAIADKTETNLCGNRLLSALPARDRDLIRSHLIPRLVIRGEVLFEPGDEVETTYFPCRGTMASFLVISADGREVEAATIGHEGAIGGIVSAGHKPAYARSVVQIGGSAFQIDTARVEDAKSSSPAFHNLFSRYADALLSQVMQSVACNALHSVEARCSRWLLSTHDRVGHASIPLTQEALAEMLGVQRTTVTAVAKALQSRGLIRYSRGRIEILNRAGIERTACECYSAVENHFTRLLPEVAQEGPQDFASPSP